MTKIGGYKPPGVGWTPSGVTHGKKPGQKPPAKPKVPPQRATTIDVGLPVTHISAMSGGVIAAVHSPERFLRAYDAAGQMLWGEGIRLYSRSQPERVQQILQAGDYTWVTSRDIHDGDCVMRIIENRAGHLVYEDLFVAEELAPHFTLIPRQGRVLKLGIDSRVTLHDYQGNKIAEILEPNLDGPLGALSNGGDKFFFSFETRGGSRYVIGYDSYGGQVTAAVRFDDKFGKPCQSLVDEQNNQLFVATDNGYLFVIDITSSECREISYPYARNGALAITLIDGQLYAVIENDYHAKLVAYNAKTHQEAWRFPSMGTIEGYSLPLGYYYDGQRNLIITCRDGLMHGLNPVDGLILGFGNEKIAAYTSFRPVQIAGDLFAVEVNAPGKRLDEKPSQTLAVYKWG
ncbi:MAG: hypothetical protein ABIE84_02280 [bacterium]